MNLQAWVTKDERPLVRLLLTVLAVGILGTAAVAFMRLSPYYSASKFIDYLMWGAVPLSGLIWGFCRWKFGSIVLDRVAVIVATVLFTSWVIVTPTFRAVGDLLQSPTVFSAVLWFFYLVALMALIDLLLMTSATPTIIAFYIVLYGIDMAFTRSFSLTATKIIVWINGVIIFPLLAALLSVVVIEVILLALWEFQTQKKS